MSKLLSILMASAFLALGGVATAADDQQSKDTAAEQSSAEGKPDQHEADSAKPESSEASAQQDDSSAQSGGEASADDADYLADIKKCEEMSGSEKTDCMDAAKKKAGRM